MTDHTGLRAAAESVTEVGGWWDSGADFIWDCGLDSRFSALTAEYIAAVDPATIIGLIDEVAALQARLDRLRVLHAQSDEYLNLFQTSYRPCICSGPIYPSDTRSAAIHTHTQQDRK